LLGANTFEGQPGAGGQVAHGPAGEHFAGAGQRADACADMDRNAAPLVASAFAFAGVNARAVNSPVDLTF
jgi:hypothetical protein